MSNDQRECNTCRESLPLDRFERTGNGDRRRLKCRRCVALGRPKRCYRCGTDLPPGSTLSQCSQCAYGQRRERVDRAYALLGDRCERCGIRHPLDLSHRDDDGADDRGRYGGRGGKYAAWFRVHVTELLTTGVCPHVHLLCANCNRLKQADPDEFARPPAYGPL